jgi:prepilin-type N-terminal cleavage/methylation domain-containing protein
MLNIRQSAFAKATADKSAIGNRQSRAFTLIEVLLALAVLAIGGVTLLELQLCSMRAADRAARQSQAVLLANQKMAEALASTSIAPGANQGLTDKDTPDGPLSWSVSVADLSNAQIQGASTTGLCSVTVDVTWPEGDVQRKVELVNYMATKTGNAQIVKPRLP